MTVIAEGQEEETPRQGSPPKRLEVPEVVALYGRGKIRQSEKVARASSLFTFLVMFYEFAFVAGKGVVQGFDEGV